MCWELFLMTLCWITKTDEESLAKVPRTGSRREGAATGCRLGIHICPTIFGSSILYWSECFRELLSDCLWPLSSKGPHSACQMKDSPWLGTGECSEFSAKNPTHGQTSYSRMLLHCSLSRVIVFKNGPVLANVDRQQRHGSFCKLFPKSLCRAGREVVVRSWVARDRIDMSTDW